MSQPATGPSPAERTPAAVSAVVGMGLTVGEPAPAFELPDQHGQPTTLGDALAEPGSRAVLLVFYPFAFSAVCGAELAELSARADELTAVGVRPLAVSTDAKYALRAYADSAGIALPLLSDFWPHGATASAYRVFDGTRGCALRGSFLIDPSGLVRWRLVHGIGEARPWSAYADALAVLDS